MKSKIKKAVSDSLLKLYPGSSADISAGISVERTNNPLHGDYSVNTAMQLSKILKKNPRQIAQEMTEVLSANKMFDKIEIAGPGFINFFVNKSAFHEWLTGLLASDEPLKSDMGAGVKVNVEFVSANPTGPLHVGHGRGAAIGDSVAAVLEAVGYDVHREYYINDAGSQMNNLALSVFARYCEMFGVEKPFPEDGYKGDYIIDISKLLAKQYGKELFAIPEAKAVSICHKVGTELIIWGVTTLENGTVLSLEGSINETLKNFNVRIDEYFSEQSLFESKEIDKTLEYLEKEKATYFKDGALWLSTELKGDGKDRVLKKSDSTYTYLAPDIAYHKNKINRRFDILIDVWGADHHGYIKRMEAALDYMGFDVKNFHVILVQMVNLLEGGEKVKMSTRAGEFITLDWLLDEVGADAARFFYNLRSGNSQFEFDIELAKSKSADNPVYYVQYCHARICSLIAGAIAKGIKFDQGENLNLLEADAELNIIRKLADFKTTLETAAKNNEPHRVAYYLQELASDYHSYYNTPPKILECSQELANAKLNLSYAVAKTVRFGLKLLGVSAPERM